MSEEAPNLHEAEHLHGLVERQQTQLETQLLLLESMRDSLQMTAVVMKTLYQKWERDMAISLLTGGLAAGLGTVCLVALAWSHLGG